MWVWYYLFVWWGVLLWVEFLDGFCLGALFQFLLRFSKRLFGFLCLMFCCLFVFLCWIVPYEALLMVEARFWSWDMAVFIFGCLVGNVFGDRIYDWVREGDDL